MKRLALVVIVALAACSSSDYDDGPVNRPRGGWGGGYGGGGDFGPAAARGGGMLDMMPPDDWWHDPRIATAVNVTADQVARLDQIAKDHGDDVSRLTRDTEVAMRDLRSTIEGDSPTIDEIAKAAQRVRTLRDDNFDRQVQLLAAERTVLTKEQWKSLQDAMHESPRDQRRRGGYGGRGGMGGRGRGRGPGWPG
jgi:Spy/CpxP family protein refolding chaperone